MGDTGALADGIVHDFRNYMQIALGSLEAIRDHLRNGRFDRAEWRIEAALQALHGAGSLAEHLGRSRTEAHGAPPLRVNDAIAGVEGLLQSALGERIELDIKLDQDLPSVRCNRLQLESALLNLAINARDAMPGGGTLSIETAEVKRTDSGGRQTYVGISVTDTGCGMTPGVLVRASETFYTTKPAGRGSGLGLAMVRTLVERLQGQLEIDSAVGRGTRVTLLLPCQPGGRVRPAPRADESTGRL
jgi:signal transduction histidine kinase